MMPVDSLRPAEAPSVQPSSPASAVRDIERLLQEIAQLAAEPLEPHAFHSELLDRTISLLAGLGGAVWVTDGGDGFVPDVVRLPADGNHRLETAELDRFRIVEETFDSGRSRVVPPDSGGDVASGLKNRTQMLLLTGAILSIDNRPVAVVEVFQRPDSPPPARAGYQQMLEDVCELAAEYYRRRELAELREKARLWGRFEEFTHHAHASLNLNHTAYTIVNESRTLIGCDRVSLLEYAAGRSRLLAVSGVDAPNRRSNTVRSGEALCTAVLKTGEPLWINGPVDDLAPQIESPLNRYLEESPARMLAVVPLRMAEGPGTRVQGQTQKPSPALDLPIIGALIAEKFDSEVDDQTAARIGAVAGQTSLALQNALDYGGRGLLGISRTAWRRSSRRGKWLAALGVLATIVALLCVIPADFEIAARGELLPVDRRDVFAPSDGTVHLANLPNEEQPAVSRNDLLAVLESRTLEMQLKRVAGEILTIKSQLQALEAARRNKRRDDEDRRPDAGRSLSAQEQELKEKLSSLQHQQATLQAEKAAMKVRSPLTGRIVTWDVVRRLDMLPVNRGDVLMQVAKLDGPWELELRLSQRDVGHLLRAQNSGEEHPTVTFTLRDSPGTAYTATVRQISRSVQEDAEGNPYVIITASIAEPDRAHFRPGATVTSRIACGRRAVGYVWFHEVIDTIRDWWAL